MAEVYNFKKVTTIVNGFIVTGYMDGEPISVSKNEDDISTHVGADGEVTWSESADETGTITINLKQTSAVLPNFIALRKSQKPFPINISDSNTRAYKTGGTEARIVKMSDRTFGTEVQGVEIQINVAKLTEG